MNITKPCKHTTWKASMHPPNAPTKIQSENVFRLQEFPRWIAFAPTKMKEICPFDLEVIVFYGGISSARAFFPRFCRAEERSNGEFPANGALFKIGFSHVGKHTVVHKRKGSYSFARHRRIHVCCSLRLGTLRLRIVMQLARIQILLAPE